jgi:hypothetical protein
MTIAPVGQLYVALCVDFTGRYIHVLVETNTWKKAVTLLEDKGLEPIEDHTIEYDLDEYDLEEVGVIHINNLDQTNYFPYGDN